MRFHMNPVEAGLLAVTTAGLAAYLYWRFRSWKMALALLAVALIPLYLSIERVSQFMTIDEPYSMHESVLIYSADSNDLRLWFERLGALRTTDVLFGTLSVVRAKLTGSLGYLQMQVLFKLLHWLLGFGVLMAVYHLLDQLFVPNRSKAAFFVLCVPCLLLLPTNALALKTYTYDILSMSLGILAILLLYVALKKDSPPIALWSAVIAFFAAQEKVISSPILLLALAGYGFLRCKDLAPSRRHLSLLGHVALGVFLILAISFGETLLVAGLRRWADLGRLLSGVPGPLVTWLWPLISFSFGGEVSAGNVVPLVAISIAAIYLAASALIIIAPLVQRRLDALAAVASRVNSVALPLIVVVGIVATYAVRAYQAPIVPVAPGNYQPLAEFNGRTQHYGAPSLPAHIAAHTAFQYAIVANDMPTVFWVFAALAFGLAVSGRGRWRQGLFVELMLLAGLLMPLAFGLLQIPYPDPPSARYVNIGMFLLSAALLLKIAWSLDGLRPRARAALSGAFALLLVAELLPFAPLYGPFRPVWASFSEERNTRVEAGHIDPVWSGWGEELMLVGTAVQAQCEWEEAPPARPDGPWAGQRCEDINLYPMFPGEWFGADIRVNHRIVGYHPLEFAETDYYVFNRMVVAAWGARFPYGVEPVMTLDQRGYVYAWVFRGSDLRAAGLDF